MDFNVLRGVRDVLGSSCTGQHFGFCASVCWDCLAEESSYVLLQGQKKLIGLCSRLVFAAAKFCDQGHRLGTLMKCDKISKVPFKPTFLISVMSLFFSSLPFERTRSKKAMKGDFVRTQKFTDGWIITFRP